jgi:transcriptional regulator with XRE-family HTH domain
MEITRKTAKENLQLLRERHGKTLEQVSEKTGVAISTLIAIEKGRVDPQATTIHKLNLYFDAI